MQPFTLENKNSEPKIRTLIYGRIIYQGGGQSINDSEVC